MVSASGSASAAPVFAMTDPDQPIRPDYEAACISGIVPALLSGQAAAGGEVPDWVPESLHGGGPVVLLVLDGLGAQQLEARRAITPTMSQMEQATITSVVPTTTAAALTSITTGTPPAAHGVVGYRLRVVNQVMNVLRWTTSSGDARDTVRPRAFQQLPSFGGERIPVVTRSEFVGTGFTDAHLFGTEVHGWRLASSLPVIAAGLVRDGAPFVYAYYDGIDSIAHETGLGDRYDAELAATDRMIADLIDRLPKGAALAITADHGQVEVLEQPIRFDKELLADVTGMSGEGRFRWLHVGRGATDKVARRIANRLGDLAWVRTLDELDEGGYFGGPLSDEFRRRLGDVAVMARAAVSFADPADPGDIHLVSRHGSLTADEMYVPLLGLRR